jgi:hypothetical protein
VKCTLKKAAHAHMASMLPPKEKGKKILEILEYLSWRGIPFTLYIECKNDPPR